MNVIRDLIHKKMKSHADASEDAIEQEISPQLAHMGDTSDHNLTLTLTDLQAKLRQSGERPIPDRPRDPDAIEPAHESATKAAEAEDDAQKADVRSARVQVASSIDGTLRGKGADGSTGGESPPAGLAAKQPRNRVRPGLADLPDVDRAGTDRGLKSESGKIRPKSPDVDARPNRHAPENDRMPSRKSKPEARVAAPDPRPATPAPSAETNDSLAEGATEILNVPAPSIGRSGQRAGRVKTRLLGFERSYGSDPFETEAPKSRQEQQKFTVGWIVVVDGPGRGTSFSVFDGVAQIGRGADQGIQLDFGDNSISRSNHAAIAYDGEQRAFFLGHGGKTNLVRLNDSPVLSTERISNGDIIRIGETKLRLVALCDENFDWNLAGQHENENAASN